MFVLLLVNADAQQTRTHAVIVELGGSGRYYSVSCERLIPVFSNVRFVPSAGVVVFPGKRPGSDFEGYEPGVPIQLKLQVGGPKHVCELGAGVVPYRAWEQIATPSGYYWTGKHSAGVYYTARLGYRYFLKSNPFNFAIAFTALMDKNHLNAYRVVPWGGASVGYLF